MHATQVLPSDFYLAYSFDIKRDIRLAFLLNGAGIVLFAVMYPLSRIALLRFRQSRELTGFNEIDIFTLITGVIVTVLAHEALHGVCFWFFTKSRPKFGFNLLYAYASAPDWYLKKTPFIVTGLAPVFSITLLGFAAILLLPVQYASVLILLISLNGAGSIGDFFVVGKLISKPSDTLIQDLGDTIYIYTANNSNWKQPTKG